MRRCLGTRGPADTGSGRWRTWEGGCDEREARTFRACHDPHGARLGLHDFAFYGAGESEVYWGFLLILIGIPTYVLILWDRRTKTGPPDAGHEPAPQRAVSA
jgi:hypothetical protein